MVETSGLLIVLSDLLALGKELFAKCCVKRCRSWILGICDNKGAKNRRGRRY